MTSQMTFTTSKLYDVTYFTTSMVTQIPGMSQISRKLATHTRQRLAALSVCSNTL